jgi:hypothetical protein
MPVVIGDTTITGLAAGGLPNNVINASNLASNGGWAPSGALVAVNTVRNSTRSSVSAGASGILFSGTFTKLRADTKITAFTTTFGAGFYSGNCGFGMRMDSSSWDYGTSYKYDGMWSGTSQTTICSGWGYWTGLAAGSHTIAVGWNTINGSTGDKPFNILNPNNNEDSRNYQMISSIIIYEHV